MEFKKSIYESFLCLRIEYVKKRAEDYVATIIKDNVDDSKGE